MYKNTKILLKKELKLDTFYFKEYDGNGETTRNIFAISF